MPDLVKDLKEFSVSIITQRKLPVPVKIELLDLNKEPFVELYAIGPDRLGFWSFLSKVLPLAPWREPSRVRFTVAGLPSFTEELPASRLS
jgi:hypothetical protein